MKLPYLLLFSFLCHGLCCEQINTYYPVETLDRLPQQQLWFHTDNAVALRDTMLNRTEIRTSGLIGTGAYRDPFSPTRHQSVGVETESYHRVGTLSLYGRMNYGVGIQDDLKWKYEQFASPRNPFFFADSIGGRYDTERFSFDAGLAGSLVEGALDYGIRVAYITGSRAKNKDPRPLVNGVRYSIRPGISYRWLAWRAGISAHAEGYEEDVKIRVLDHLKMQQYFLFMGLGHVHREQGTDLSRDCNGKNLGGSVQVGYETAQQQHLIFLKYLTINERGTLGSAFNPFKSGDYASQEIALRYFFRHRGTNNSNGIFHASLSRYDDRGVWYDQLLDPLKLDPPEWIVFNKSVKWTKSADDLQLGYLFMKEQSRGRDYTLGASAIFHREQEQAYPNNELLLVENLTLQLQADKSIYFMQQNKLLFEADVSWRKNLSKQARLDGVGLKDQISYPVFDFLSSDYIHSKLSITFAWAYRASPAGLTRLTPYVKSTVSGQQATRTVNGRTKNHRMLCELVFGLLF